MDRVCDGLDGRGLPFDQAVGGQIGRTVVCAEELTGTGHHVDDQEQQVDAGFCADTTCQRPVDDSLGAWRQSDGAWLRSLSQSMVS